MTFPLECGQSNVEGELSHHMLSKHAGLQNLTHGEWDHVCLGSDCINKILTSVIKSVLLTLI